MKIRRNVARPSAAHRRCDDVGLAAAAAAYCLVWFVGAFAVVSYLIRHPHTLFAVAAVAAIGALVWWARQRIGVAS